MRIEREHDDLRLHELRRRAEANLDRRGAFGDRRQLLLELLHRSVGQDRPHPRRTGQRHVRRAEARQLRVELRLDFGDAFPGGTMDGREDEDPALRASRHAVAHRSPSSEAGSSERWSAWPPPGSGTSDPVRKKRSTRFPVCESLKRTTLSPAKVPMPAPTITSLAQWRLLYMRDTPTSAAPVYSTGPTIHFVFGALRDVSAVTAA